MMQEVLEAIYNNEDKQQDFGYLMSTPPEERDAYYYNIYDAYQKVYTQILNPFLPWVFLIILVNRKNLKKPINILLILHFVFRSIGTAIYNTQNIRVNMNITPNLIFPFGERNWYISFAVSNIFWTLDELCADWYPLLRTKAVTKNNPKKIRPVIAVCLFFNSIKLFIIYSFFFKPYPIVDDVTKMTPTDQKNLSQYKLYWWSIVSLIQVASFMYDLSVILTLRKCLFNRLKEFQGVSTNNYGFLERFKQISEYRIMFSIISSLSFLPFILGFIYFCFYKPLKGGEDFDINKADADFALENIRQTVININCNLMFIDQILLRFVVKRNASSGYRSNKNNSTSSYKNSTTNVSYKNYSNPSYKNNLSTNSFKSKLLHSDDYYNNLYNLNYTKLEGYSDNYNNSYTDSETVVNPSSSQIHMKPIMQPIQQFPNKYKPIIQFHQD